MDPCEILVEMLDKHPEMRNCLPARGAGNGALPSPVVGSYVSFFFLNESPNNFQLGIKENPVGNWIFRNGFAYRKIAPGTEELELSFSVQPVYEQNPRHRIWLEVVDADTGETLFDTNPDMEKDHIVSVHYALPWTGESRGYRINIEDLGPPPPTKYNFRVKKTGLSEMGIVLVGCTGGDEAAFFTDDNALVELSGHSCTGVFVEKGEEEDDKRVRVEIWNRDKTKVYFDKVIAEGEAMLEPFDPTGHQDRDFTVEIRDITPVMHTFTMLKPKGLAFSLNFYATVSGENVCVFNTYDDVPVCTVGNATYIRGDLYEDIGEYLVELCNADQSEVINSETLYYGEDEYDWENRSFYFLLHPYTMTETEFVVRVSPVGPDHTFTVDNTGGVLANLNLTDINGSKIHDLVHGTQIPYQKPDGHDWFNMMFFVTIPQDRTKVALELLNSKTGDVMRTFTKTGNGGSSGNINVIHIDITARNVTIRLTAE